MTRWVLTTIPKIDDEIEFVIPPFDWENPLFSLKHCLSGLEECLDLIDKEKRENNTNE